MVVPKSSKDGSKLILKFYHDDIPLEILTLGVKPIEHKEMLIIVSSSEWQV